MADMPDPKSLSDEELDKILEGEEPEQPEEKEPEAPKEGEEVVETEEEEPEEEEPESPALEEPKPSRREQLRINQLLEKLKEQPKQSQAPKQSEDVLDYEKTLDADPELIARLTEDRNRSTQAAWQQGIEQAKSIQFHTRLEIDAPRVHDKYPILNKESDDFHPGVANAINSMYLASSGFNPETDTVQNPNVRYGEYVESIFELAKEIAGDMVQEKTQTIKKQAAQTGLRPDGSGAKKLNLNKPADQMSNDELDAYLKYQGLA
jgi:hypothetical protein